ncbi:hypothetical protein Aperf_G00000128991 [Anoplocephala perfoliata]
MFDAAKCCQGKCCSCLECTSKNSNTAKNCALCSGTSSSTAEASTSKDSTPAFFTTDDFFVAFRGLVLGHPFKQHASVFAFKPSSLIYSRKLTSIECQHLRLLSDDINIREDQSLIDLARDLGRDDWIKGLSNRISNNISPAITPQSRPRVKRSLCQANPSTSKEIRAGVEMHIRKRNGAFPCHYIVETGNFFIPAEVRLLPKPTQSELLQDICDMEAQRELEVRSAAINWWIKDGKPMWPTSRLIALWNRTNGDCLLDSLMQACWGVLDQEGILRRTLADSMYACEERLFEQWHEYEVQEASKHYEVSETQLRRDWRSSMVAASSTRTPLEQIHIFVLAHILRCPIIVYSVKFIRNYRDEPIAESNFQGIYLPLLWERCFCSKVPVILGYTKGHFSALVPIKPLWASAGTSSPAANATAAATSSENLAKSPTSGRQEREDDTVASDDSDAPRKDRYIYLPLFDVHGNSMAVPFASKNASTSNDAMKKLICERLNVRMTRRGQLLVKIPSMSRQNFKVDELVNEWLKSYRKMTVARASSEETSFKGIDVPFSPDEAPRHRA